MTIYIYGLRCPLANEIRYVGKSTNPQKRARSHMLSALRSDYNHHTARWLRKLASDGNEPILEIIREVAHAERWQDVEREEIAAALARGCRLTNSTLGGEGLDYIDPEDDAAYRANLSASLKRLWSSPERREEARQRSVALHADPEISGRRATSLRDFYKIPENKARASAIASEVNSRPEVKAKKAKSVAQSWVGSDERRAGIANGEHNRKLSESAKARWSDPELRAQALDAINSEAARAKKSQRAIERATPEYRAMMAEKTRLSWEKRRQKTAAQISNSQAA